MADRQGLTKDELADLVAEYPLPDGVPDALLNRQELADFFSVAANTVTAWMTAGLPVEKQGTNGQAYEFRASHCYAWKQSRDRSEREARSEAQLAIMAMRLALTGGKPGSSIEALSPSEKKEAITAQIAYEQFQRTRHELIDRADVVEMLEGVFVLARDVLGSLPDTLERENMITADQAEKVIALCDDTLDDMRGRIERFFLDRPLKAGEKDAPVTLFDA